LLRTRLRSTIGLAYGRAHERDHRRKPQNFPALVSVGQNILSKLLVRFADADTRP
jgi:hypothetical protein